MGVKFEYFDGRAYIITKIESSTSFRVTREDDGVATHGKTTSYNHEPNGILLNKHSSNNGFVVVSGLTASGDNRIYKVVSATDTVLTLEDMAGNNPNITTENGVTITLSTFVPVRQFIGLEGGSLSATLTTTGDADDYINTWRTSINAVSYTHLTLPTTPYV